MRANRRDFVAGIVFLGGILAVGYMTVVIHGFSALVGPRLTPLEVHFPDVAGLEVGEEVRAKGVKVGQVASVSYRPDGHIGVGIRLFSDPRLREGCAFHVRAKSPLGGNYVDIDPGPPGAPLTTADTFAGEHPTDLFAELGKVLGEKRDTIMAIIDNLGDTTQALREERGTWLRARTTLQS